MDSTITKKKKNLVLGIIYNYDFFDICRFVFSLKKTNYDGDICLYVNSIGNRTRKKLEKLGILTVDFKRRRPYLFYPHESNQFTLPRTCLENYRHLLYYNFILQHKDDYDLVLITDVRDVVFQRNPFDFIIEDYLYCAVEIHKINSRPITSEWITAGYGTEALAKIGDNLISCAGTTIGNVNLMLEYLEQMLIQIGLVKDAIMCVDQGIHNYIIYNDLLKKIKFVDNKSGFILTIGNTKGYEMNNSCLLLNYNNEVVNIVHQYDRYPELKKIVDKKIFNNLLQKYYIKYTFMSKKKLKEKFKWLRRKRKL